MDHKAFLAEVPAERRAVLTARQDRAGFLHLTGHIAALVFVGALIGAGVPGWWVLLPVQGVLLMGLFMLTHECTHRTPFRTVWLNDVVGQIAGFAILLPFRWFRYFHMAHHKWTNIPGKDPELNGAKPTGFWSWVWHISGVPLWWRLALIWLGLARGREVADWLPERARATVARDARIGLSVFVLICVTAVFVPVILWVWLLPLVLGQPFLRLYLLAEHGDCPQVANMFDNTRTTFTNRFVRWLTWNMPFHTEHHVWPDVPFHQLPALHEDMRAQLSETADGYVAFNRAYLARRLQPAAGADRASPAE